MAASYQARSALNLVFGLFDHFVTYSRVVSASLLDKKCERAGTFSTVALELLMK